LSEALVRHTLDGIRLEDARHAIYDHDLRDGTPISPAAFREFAQAENNWREGLSELAGCVRFVASLSKIDGLILMTPDFRLLAFGVEILGASEVEKVSIAENESATHLREKKANHFGTRHRSMMRYCCIHSNALGFVVSKHSRTERVRSGSLKTGDLSALREFCGTGELRLPVGGFRKAGIRVRPKPTSNCLQATRPQMTALPRLMSRSNFGGRKIKSPGSHPGRYRQLVHCLSNVIIAKRNFNFVEWSCGGRRSRTVVAD